MVTPFSGIPERHRPVGRIREEVAVVEAPRPERGGRDRRRGVRPPRPAPAAPRATDRSCRRGRRSDPGRRRGRRRRHRNLSLHRRLRRRRCGKRRSDHRRRRLRAPPGLPPSRRARRGAPLFASGARQKGAAGGRGDRLAADALQVLFVGGTDPTGSKVVVFASSCGVFPSDQDQATMASPCASAQLRNSGHQAWPTDVAQE